VELGLQRKEKKMTGEEATGARLPERVPQLEAPARAHNGRQVAQVDLRTTAALCQGCQDASWLWI
jgi:hypothetical protein